MRSESFGGTSVCSGQVIDLDLRKGSSSIRAAQGDIRSFEQDRTIIWEGQLARNAYEVVSGTVRTCSLFTDGRRQVYDFLLPGDIFGLDAGSVSTTSAEAVTDVVVRLRRRSDLLPSTAVEMSLHARYQAALIREARRMRELILSLGRRTAAERVASFLILLCERQGGGKAVDLPMPRLDIADHLGLTVETVSRVFTHFRKAGLIDVASAHRSVLIRDAAALHRLQAGNADGSPIGSETFWPMIAAARSH